MPRPKAVYPPPTQRHIDGMREKLQRCAFIETAASMAGIPKKHLLSWIERGRAGDPEYSPFVDMIDEENAKLSAMIWENVYRESVERQNFTATQFIFKHRLEHHEKRLQEKIDKIEDRLEEEVAAGAVPLSEEELTAMEERVAAELEKVH